MKHLLVGLLLLVCGVCGTVYPQHDDEPKSGQSDTTRFDPQYYKGCFYNKQHEQIHCSDGDAEDRITESGVIVHNHGNANLRSGKYRHDHNRPISAVVDAGIPLLIHNSYGNLQ